MHLHVHTHTHTHRNKKRKKASLNLKGVGLVYTQPFCTKLMPVDTEIKSAIEARCQGLLYTTTVEMSTGVTLTYSKPFPLVKLPGKQNCAVIICQLSEFLS